jgi:CheY-like chemotaxis protein
MKRANTPEGHANYLPRLLVVDDNPRLIPLLKRSIEAGGFQVIICTNGQQAWSYLQTHHNQIDLMLTDLSMPLLSGQELIKRVHGAGWGLPVIILSAQTNACDYDDLQNKGVCRVLSKPHDVKDLPKHISEILEQRGRLNAVRLERAVEPDLPTILMVEDDPIFSMVLGNVLKKKLVGARVLSCSTVKQAQYMLESFLLTLLITDLNLPDGNSLGLICSLLDLQPKAHVIMVTASRVPLLKQRAEALGLIRFLEKPIQPLELADLAYNFVHPHPQSSITRSVARITQGLGRYPPGSPVQPLTDLQRRCQSRHSCTLSYHHPDLESGELLLQHGKILHAACGDLLGMPALIEILAWDSAQVSVSAFKEAKPNLPNRGWQSLLMEAVRFDARLSQLPPTQVGAHRWNQR